MLAALSSCFVTIARAAGTAASVPLGTTPGIAVPIPAPSPAPSGRYIGVNALTGETGPEITMQKIKEGGMNTYRDAISWAYIEKQRGVYEIYPGWPAVQAVDLAVQNGIEPLIELVYHNDLYPNIADPANGATRSAFANYAAYVARYFGSKVKMYEVWNEWNGGIFQGCRWREPCSSAVTYADLLCKTYQKLKAVNPNLIVAGGAVSGADIYWIQILLSSGGGACMDVLSIHPYTYAFQQTWGTAKGPSAAVDAMMLDLDKIHTMLKNKTGRDIPIYITEEGMVDATSSQQEDAANYLTMVVTQAKSRPFIQGFWWFDLRDAPDSSNKANMGMLYYDYSPKKPYTAMQQVAPAW